MITLSRLTDSTPQYHVWKGTVQSTTLICRPCCSSSLATKIHFASLIIPKSLAPLVLSGCRARLPSLYSDFSTQKQTNPDGYFVNVEAWQKALAHAALAGKICSSPSTHGDILVLTANNALVSDLESKEFGCPVALSCVIVRTVY